MTPTHKIIHADCLAAMNEMEPNMFDAIVTDPPYGLSFMGKEWDHGVPGVEFWTAALRVAKPGAHLLAFGGTRTFHRLACAIEDAGWEIRDCIMWVYGCLSDDTEVLTPNGWELYHKARLGEILAYDPEADVYKWEKPERWSSYRVEQDTAYRIESDSTDQIVSRNHRCLVERGGSLVFVAAEECASVERVPYLQGDISPLSLGRGTLLLKTMLRESQDVAQIALVERQGEEATRNGNGGLEESSVEGRADVFQEEGQVRGSVDQVCSLPDGVHGYGAEGRLCHGASLDCGNGVGAVAVAERVCTSHQPQCDGQPTGEPDAVCVELRPQAARTRPSYQATVATVTPIKYTGMIFCPTVSTGAFVARRNGKVFLTGNSGFPKSHNIGLSIDKLGGAPNRGHRIAVANRHHPDGTLEPNGDNLPAYECQTGDGKPWQGWGTALKPAVEYVICAQKHLTLGQECVRLARKIGDAICQLQSSASAAGPTSQSSFSEFGAASGSALWSAAARCNSPDGLFALTAMSRSGLAPNSSLSTGLSWLDTLAAVLQAENTFTTEMVSSLTTDLRILNSLPSKSTAESMLPNATNQLGTGSSASLAGSIFNVVSAKLASTLTPSALGFATSPDGAPGVRPDWEPILVARKPLAGTVAANVKEFGTGGINIDGCRVEGLVTSNPLVRNVGGFGSSGLANQNTPPTSVVSSGRWPANLIHDGSQAVLDLFPETGKSTGGGRANGDKFGGGYAAPGCDSIGFGDSGSAARFFYCAKASKRDRNEGMGDGKNGHATVKPTDLMRYLCRLVTPPEGTVLDPFCGSGSTGKAAILEGFSFVGIEKDEVSADTARKRVEFAASENDK